MNQQILEKYRKLDKLSHEFVKLKKAGVSLPKFNISLKGTLKGFKVNNKEIRQSRKSFFKEKI